MYAPARYYLSIFSPLSGYPNITKTWDIKPSATAHKLSLNTCAGGSAVYVGTKVKDRRSGCSAFFRVLAGILLGSLDARVVDRIRIGSWGGFSRRGLLWG